jgi:hypothetical protein
MVDVHLSMTFWKLTIAGSQERRKHLLQLLVLLVQLETGLFYHQHLLKDKMQWLQNIISLTVVATLVFPPETELSYS